MANSFVEPEMLVLDDSMQDADEHWCTAQVLGFTEALNMATLKLHGVPPKEASKVTDLKTESHLPIQHATLMNLLPYQVLFSHVPSDLYVHQVLNLDSTDINPKRNLTRRGKTATMNGVSTSCGFLESFEYILAVAQKYPNNKFVVILPMPTSDEFEVTKKTLTRNADALRKLEEIDIILFADPSYRYIIRDTREELGDALQFKGVSAIDAVEYVFADTRRYFIVTSNISQAEIPLLLRAVYGSCTTHDERYQTRYEIDVKALLPEFLSSANFDILPTIYGSHFSDARIGCNSKTINFAYSGNGEEVSIMFVIDCLDTHVPCTIVYPDKLIIDTIHACLHKDADANSLQKLHAINDCKDESLLSFKTAILQSLFNKFFPESNIYMGPKRAPPLKRPLTARVASER